MSNDGLLRKISLAGTTCLSLCLVFSSSALVISTPAHAQVQKCYQDDRGRIVTRRRPGYAEVPCPGAQAQPQVTPSVTDNQNVTAPSPVQQGTGLQPSVPSVVNRPATQAPVQSVPTGSSVVFQESRPGQEQQQTTTAIAPISGQVSPVTSDPAGLYQLPSGGVGRSSITQLQVNEPVAVLPNKPVSPIPRPTLADYPEVDEVALADRWRIVEALPGYKERLVDPYNRNPLKADKPLHDDWFFSFLGISDSIVETRDVPTPVGSSSTLRPGSIGIFGDPAQTIIANTFLTELVYYKGNTVFRPPDHEWRLTLGFNYNYTDLAEIQGINADPRREDIRNDRHLGIQAAFYDKHLRNVSDRYDFDSFRIGIQPFSTDFRGFLFQDNQFGARLFGTRQNNIYQYNLAWFRRIEKDTNSGLNAVGPLRDAFRDDDVFVANLYRQDFPVKGFFSQGTVVYNRNREDYSRPSDYHYDNNLFIQRPSSLGLELPRQYDVFYLGYNGDGHFDRINVTTANYLAFGRQSPGVFVNDDVDIAAAFSALEVSIDYSWFRPRFSFMYASGDSDPTDDVATGFDAIFENPQFAGGDTTYWNRQPVPLIAGGRVTLSNRNALLNSLRSSKEEGQSNFTNPGLLLVGIGADMDLYPQLRLSFNLNSLRFVATEVLEFARNQPSIDKDIGLDASISLQYRPLMSQNIVLRASYARLFPGDGFDDLFPGESAGYFLFNATLNY